MAVYGQFITSVGSTATSLRRLTRLGGAGGGDPVTITGFTELSGRTFSWGHMDRNPATGKIIVACQKLSPGASIPFLFKSTDDGYTFSSIAGAPNYFSNNYNQLIFANGVWYYYHDSHTADANAGFYRSTDDGVTWEKRTGLFHGDTQRLSWLFYWKETDALYYGRPVASGGEYYIYESRNQGASWTPITSTLAWYGFGFGNTNWKGIAASEHSICSYKQDLFSLYDIYRTNDKSLNPAFSLASELPSGTLTMKYVNGTFYAKDSNKLFRSDDDGVTWAEQPVSGLPAGNGYLSIHGGNGVVLLMPRITSVSPDHFFWSNNDGRDWIQETTFINSAWNHGSIMWDIESTDPASSDPCAVNWTDIVDIEFDNG